MHTLKKLMLLAIAAFAIAAFASPATSFAEIWKGEVKVGGKTYDLSKSTKKNPVPFSVEGWITEWTGSPYYRELKVGPCHWEMSGNLYNEEEVGQGNITSVASDFENCPIYDSWETSGYISCKFLSAVGGPSPIAINTSGMNLQTSLIEMQRTTTNVNNWPCAGWAKNLRTYGNFYGKFDNGTGTISLYESGMNWYGPIQVSGKLTMTPAGVELGE